MVFIDYKGQKIELTTEAWEIHIKENHPDISVSEIEETLKNPDEVWESQNRTDAELYYKRKKTSVSGKIRYWMVAVKKSQFRCLCFFGNDKKYSRWFQAFIQKNWRC